MNLLKSRALTLLAATALAATACQGSKGSSGANGADGSSGSNGVTGVNGGQTTGLVLALTGAPTINADQSVTLRFTAKDDQGFPVDLLNGKYSLNTVNVPRFAIAQIKTAADGSVLPYNVLTATGSLSQDPALPAPDPATVKTSPGTATPSLTAPDAAKLGVLVENGTGAGDYSYTFPTGTMTSAPGTGSNAGKTTYSVSGGVKIDPSSTASYTVWIQAQRQINVSNVNDPKGFKAVNYQYSFVPGSNATPLKREIVTTSACSKCHNAFKSESTLATGGFHGYGRVEGPFCNVCHNAARQSTATNSDTTDLVKFAAGTGTPAADSAIFVHRLHSGARIQTANVFHGINDVSYPQDLRNCDACHAGAAQGAQAKTRADRAVCGSCHDYVDFAGTKAAISCTNPVTVDSNGLPVPCVHLPGANTDDTSCAGCHVAGGKYFIGDKHVAVAMPDPKNSLLPTGDPANTHTNQMYVAATGELPAGAIQLKYVVSSVAAVADAGAVLRPQITFKFQQSTDGTNFTDVVFNTFGSGKTELMDNFVGSPSVEFAFSVPQDGITAPADFNATAAAYIKNVWNGTVLPAVATMTGPDSKGLYTIALTGTIIPANAKMLTGGIGYTYGTSSTQPMTQTNVPGYTYNWDPYSNTAVAGVGGLLVPVQDAWAVATGYTGRRKIVENARCLNCHTFLGVNPTFHAGQRNDGPTCSFCHNANQNNSGWAGNAKDFIHGLHAGLQAGSAMLPDGVTTVTGGSGVRTVPYGWHALSATEGYWDVTFPGQHNYCQACHAPGTYDFSAAASSAAVPNMLWSTEATGILTAGFGSAPSNYVTYGGAGYGAGFSYKASTGVITPASATTLVTSPITAACVACHDSPAMRAHMVANGGSFYVARSAATAVEQCLLCHGPQPGAIAPIAPAHQ